MDYKKMAVFNTAGNITYLLFLWLLTVLVTRVAGYEAAGILALAMSISNVIVSFQLFGVRSYQVSDVSGVYTGQQYVAGRYLTTVVGLVFCIIYCVMMDYAVETVTVILTYSLYRSCEAISDVYWGEMQKNGRLDISAVSFAAKGLSLIGLTALALHLGMGLQVGLILSALTSLSITFFFDRVQYRKLTEQKMIRLTMRQVLAPLYSCFTLLLTTMFPVILAALPRIFLERYSGAEMLGYYGNVSAPTTLISSLAPSILVPVMTWYGKLFQSGEKKKLLSIFFLTLVACLLLGIVACAAVFVAGEWVMSFIFTQAILPYIHYLYPLISSTVLYAWTICANAVLISVRETNPVAVFSAAALLIAGVLSNLLVKEMAISGVILTLTAAYTTQFLLQLIWIIIWYRRTEKGDTIKNRKGGQ